MEFHEAANIFPLDEESLGELADDIRANGQQVAIETLGGKIIDGRRRYLACERAGVKPRFREVQTDDPVAYVVSLNLHRRHLTVGQRSMCAAKATALREKFAAEARERKKRKPADVVVPNLAQQTTGERSRDQHAKLFNVSHGTLGSATKVLHEAVPELVKAVEDGRMAVSAAAQLVDESEDVQREAAETGKRPPSSVPVFGSVIEPLIETYLDTGKWFTQQEAMDCLNATKPAVKKVIKRLRNGSREDVTLEECKTGNCTKYRLASLSSEPEEGDRSKRPGKGVQLAHEAINCLIRIPKNDALRRRGLQIVADWIEAHK